MKHLLASMIISFASLATASEEVVTAVVNDQTSIMPDLLERMEKHHIPSVSIAVINDGRVAWCHAYGVKEKGTEKKVSETTLYQAASISKSVAAFGALLLVQEGKLNLDTNIDDKLTSWSVLPNTFTKDQSICLRNLLNHTAGFSVSGFDGYLPSEKIPNLIEILEGRCPANNPPILVERTPGIKMTYSGGGYIVMQQLVEDVTAQSFAKFMQEYLLHPIGMSHSTFCVPLPIEDENAAALGHQDVELPMEGGWKNYPQSAAAGLWSTPTDLAKFLIATQNALLGNSETILERSLAEEIIKTQNSAYGLGFFVHGTGRQLKMSHTGHNHGFLCKFVSFPYLRQGAVVMMNTDHSGSFEFIEEILGAIAEAYEWPSFP